jgi:high-affinity K+ transport system ATPase subunit B
MYFYFIFIYIFHFLGFITIYCIYLEATQVFKNKFVIVFLTISSTTLITTLFPSTATNEKREYNNAKAKALEAKRKSSKSNKNKKKMEKKVKAEKV